MEPSLHIHVVAMWMMLSMAMTNSLTFKSKLMENLKVNREGPLQFYFISLLFLLVARRKPRAARLFWVEPRQSTHWNYVERVVWRTTDRMHEAKFKKFYRMSFAAFDNLLNMLIPFLRSRCVNQVRPQMEIKKIVACVIYRFAHGHSAEHMADRFKIGASTIRKYVDIVCDILCDGDKLFSQFISIPTGDRLKDIISDFQDLTRMPNICGAIDGTHIPLAENPSKRITLAACDFYNRKKFNSTVLQAVCDSKKLFWNVCASQPGGVHDGGQFKVSSLYRSLKRREILQDPVVSIGGVRCTPYLIGDAAYPIRTYLIKNWKAPNDLQKKRFDHSMNSGRVVIEQAFGSLKNRWRILKHFNSRVDRAASVTIACCWLHNYCEMMNQPEPHVANVDLRRDPLVGFGNARLAMDREGDFAKRQGEILRQRLFRQWVIENPNDE